MPTYIRAAAQTLRSGTVLRGLADDEGKIWIVSLDLSREVEGVEESSGDSLISHRVRSGIPGGDLFSETVFMSVTTIPHLATAVLDMPMSPDQDEKDWLSELLGEPLDELFAGLTGDADGEGAGDKETAVPIEFVDDAPPLLVGHVLGSPRGGGLIPGRSLVLDSDADVWLPVETRAEAPHATDPWAAIRAVVAHSERCETIIGPGSKHPAMRVGGEDVMAILLSPRVMTQALSTPEAMEALTAAGVDLDMWRWLLTETLPRAMEEVAPLRSTLMKPSLAAGTDRVSITDAAQQLGMTAPALVSALELRGSVSRTGSALRPWKVTGDADLITVVPASGHAMWCLALASSDAVTQLRTRLGFSGLL